MIDRTWLIHSDSVKTTSQAHGGIKPHKLMSPNKKNDMLAGAGTPARRILASSNDFKVHVIGGWSNKLNRTLQDEPEILIPEITHKKRDRIKLERFASTEFDTLKWRIYSSASNLEFRYDIDLKSGDYSIISDTDWPPPNSTAAVIVADFAKGLLNIPEIREKLKNYKGCPFLLRTKQRKLNAEKILTDLPWTVLLPNREDLARILESRDIRPRALKILHGGVVAISPHIIEIFDDLLTKFKSWNVYNQNEDKQDIFLKLDYEGGILLTKEGKIGPITLRPEDSIKNLAGIGSGDVLMAELAIKLANSSSEKLKNNNYYFNIYKDVIREASEYALNAKYVDYEDFYGIKFGKNNYTYKHNVEPIVGELCDFDTIKTNWKNASENLNIKDIKKIEMHNSDWYLENYITTDKDFGIKLEDLRKQFEKYVEDTDINRKPFVVALCGKPGAGKSYLAKRYAKIVDCEYIEGNVAQWVSFDDFFIICEKIRSSQIRKNGKPPLVFLDEIDSKIGTQNLYSKLLAPLWDRKYTKNGEEKEIGPVIFLLAGSGERWADKVSLLGSETMEKSKNKKEEVEKKEKVEKLDDLVSRLRYLPIEIKDIEERKPDIIYIVVDLIKKNFPNVKKIGKRTLYLLCESKPKYGVRSLDQAIKNLQMIEENDTIYLDENNEENELLYELHLVNIKNLVNNTKLSDNDTIDIITEPKKINITVVENLFYKKNLNSMKNSNERI